MDAASAVKTTWLVDGVWDNGESYLSVAAAMIEFEFFTCMFGLDLLVPARLVERHERLIVSHLLQLVGI